MYLKNIFFIGSGCWKFLAAERKEKKSWKLVSTWSDLYVRKYCIYNTFDISIFDMMGAAFPWNFSPACSSYTASHTFSFLLLLISFSATFPIRNETKEKHFIFILSIFFFLTNFSSSSAATTTEENCVFKSLMIEKSKREWEKKLFFQGVVRNPFSRVAIYLWRIKSWRGKNLKQIKINFDRVENECEWA